MIRRDHSGQPDAVRGPRTSDGTAPPTSEIPQPPQGAARRKGRRRIAIGLSLLAGLGLIAAAWWNWPRCLIFYTDADTIRQPAQSATLRDILWQPPKLLAGSVNSVQDDYEPRISADGLNLYFVRGRAGQNADLYVATRTREGWSDPRMLNGANSEYDDLGPEPSSDGTTLYFYSNRPGGLGGYDLWVTRCVPNECEAPTHLGPNINSEFNDYGPALTSDGTTLYFASNRPQPTDIDGPKPDAWPATVREDLFQRDYDLYSAPVTPAGAGPATVLLTLNSPYNEGAPAVSPFGDFLYFSSDRPGGQGAFDLYRSRRLRGSHEPVENLGPEVNSPDNELDPGLTLGGFGLYFSSDRKADGPLALPGTTVPQVPRNYDLFQTASREIFLETERIESPPVDWAAWWSRMVPNLMWALLALLLLLSLLALMGALRNRRLSLLSRCVLASLFLHLALMLIFNVWEVTVSLADQLHGGGSIRVSLLSSAAGNDIALQIRGTGFEIAMPQPNTPEIRRTDYLPDSPTPTSVVQLQTEAMPIRIDLHPATTFQSTQVDVTLVRFATPEVQPITQIDWSAAMMLPEDLGSKVADHPESVVSGHEVPSGLLEIVRADLALQPPSSGLRRTWDVSAEVEPEPQRNEEPSNQLAVLAAAIESIPSLTATSYSIPPLNPSLSKQFDEFALPDKPESSSAARESTPSEPVSVVMAAPRWTRQSADVDGRSAKSGPVVIPIDDSIAIPRTPIEPIPFGSSMAPAMSPIPDALRPEAPNSEPDRSPIELSLPPIGVVSQGAVIETVEKLGGAMTTQADSSLPRANVATVGASTTALAVVVPNTTWAPPSPAQSIVSELIRNSGEALPEFRSVEVSDNTRAPFPSTAMIPDFRIPSDVKPPENVYPQRAVEKRNELVKRLGGSTETERAVAAALKWLAAHQSDDGSWSGRGFDRHCGQCGGESSVEVDAALTGLALLCFLGADHTHLQEGPYKGNVERGLQWLKKRQKSDGDLRGDETLYSQGIAAIALSEAYGMTGDEWLAPAVERAVDFICKARNREAGGWRYDPGQPGDTSVLGWQVMALKSAKTAGLSVPQEAFDAAREWLVRVSSPGQPGRYAYQPRREYTPAMTAEGIFVHHLLGLHPNDSAARSAAEYLVQNPPKWGEHVNTYYWYYATLALFQQQGQPWERWNKRLTKELLSHQRHDGGAAGSWDPEGEWASTGGRVYQTALCTLMLEVYYRYLPMYAPAVSREAIGTIRGRVADTRGMPLPGANIRLDVAAGDPIVATSGADGAYSMEVPEVPTYFALSASADGFAPDAVNLSLSAVRGTTFVQDFALQPKRWDVIALESVPEVHHLGDDHFEGRINSQFQKHTEGAHFVGEFEIDAASIASNAGSAELSLLVKGVQRKHEIRINGQLIEKRLDRAPADGSFGEFTASFDGTLLHAGINTLAIFATSLGGDVDDFEFVNVEIRLAP